MSPYADPDQARAWARADSQRRRAQNPFPNRAIVANRKWGERLHWSILARISHLPCFRCGAVPSGVDHIVPKPRGGRHIVSNLQPACIRCNQRKGHRQ